MQFFPQGVWHDNHRPDDQWSYATFSSPHMSGKTFKELKLKSQEIQLNQNSYMLRLTEKNVIQVKDIKADSLKYTFFQGCCCSALYPHCTQVKQKNIFFLILIFFLIGTDSECERREKKYFFPKHFFLLILIFFLIGTDSECERRDSGNGTWESHLVEPGLPCLW